MYTTIAFSSLLIAASSVYAYPQAPQPALSDIVHTTVPVAAATTATVAAATTTAAALGGSTDTSVTVILENQAIELGSQTTFKSVNSKKTKAPVGSSGPFETIEINVGADANPALRCQALDSNGTPLIATRGANTDTTFSDADKGAWTFITPSTVSAIVCDPSFVAVAPGSYDVTVILQDQATETGSQTILSGVVRDVDVPVGSSGPFSTVEISVGPLVNPALRCKVKNARGRAIVATRGENIDTTFSDADKGAWTFQKSQSVSKIICDPIFVAAPQ